MTLVSTDTHTRLLWDALVRSLLPPTVIPSDTLLLYWYCIFPHSYLSLSPSRSSAQDVLIVWEYLWITRRLVILSMYNKIMHIAISVWKIVRSKEWDGEKISHGCFASVFFMCGISQLIINMHKSTVNLFIGTPLICEAHWWGRGSLDE